MDRTARIELRVTPAEKQAIEEHAAAQGLKAGPYLRRLDRYSDREIGPDEGGDADEDGRTVPDETSGAGGSDAPIAPPKMNTAGPTISFEQRVKQHKAQGKGLREAKRLARAEGLKP